MRDAALARIRLRHLQCFLAVAQFGNLRRAAQALSITQPAVTKTVNELEALLAKPLFVRGRHGATLTAEGEAFMRHAGESVDALGFAVDSVLREPDAPPLRIGVLPTVAPSFLPGVLHAFAARWPLVAVRVATGRNTELVAQLRARELDAVIGRLSDPELMAGLSFESLYTEPMVIVLRPGHALAPGGKARTRGTKVAPALTAIGAYPLVLPLAGTLIRQVADGFLSRHGISAQAGLVETLDTSLARSLVLQGDNLWFTPAGAVLPDLASGALLRLGVALTPEEPVGLILRTEPGTSATVQTFVGAVRAQAALGRTPRKRQIR
ncbi:MAG: LysR substrate-binding domain-containing protein [Burkholderiales bacterium]|nr:LysR substrate-binding domain-containing protein [Burkholderiales bacterium]